MSLYLTPDELKKLNEKERRLTIAQYALDYGHGGIAEMNRRYGISRVTISKGIKELKSGQALSSDKRIRKEGGGRKHKSDSIPNLDHYILQIAGNDIHHPDKSVRKIVGELKEKHGIEVSRMTVQRTLEKYR